MIINLDEYVEKMYVYRNDEGEYIAYKDNPKDIQEKLKQIDNEYFEIIGSHLITFE